ncbi:MAG: helix-turn-helix domain-containing protein [Nitrospiria bacterium]
MSQEPRTARECLFELDSKMSRLESQTLLSKHIGVAPDTVYRWLTGKYFPQGAELVKLWYTLERLGYEVKEIHELDSQLICEIGRYFTDGQLSQGELLECLDTKNPSYVWRLLTGKVALSSVQKDKLTELLNRMEKVSRKKANSYTPKTIEIDSLVYLIHQILPIAERAASDWFTEEDRAGLRAKLGKYDIFNLANHLYQLCGEDAREIYSGKGKTR